MEEIVTNRTDHQNDLLSLPLLIVNSLIFEDHPPIFDYLSSWRDAEQIVAGFNYVCVLQSNKSTIYFVCESIPSGVNPGLTPNSKSGGLQRVFHP